MQSGKKKLLIVCDWFDPAYKAGGPIQSAVNFVRQMKDDYHIFIITSNRDLNDSKPMESVLSDQWIDYVTGVRIYYASVEKLRLTDIKAHLSSIKPEIIYLNSMFSKSFTIYPLWLKRFGVVSSQIILAPRGMLKASALNFKKRKKKIFLSIFRWLKIPQRVTFHATDEQEKEDLIRQFGPNTKVVTIPNFPSTQDELSLPLEKHPGNLKILFIGRIHPIKGLDVLLKSVIDSKQHLLITVVGNIEDINYSLQCNNLLGTLPNNVEVQFMKGIPHHAVQQIIKDHHILCLPTRGENFGHAIFESLAAGRPVLISDQTPWHHLSESRAGWDVPLNEPSRFTEIIEQCALMNADQFYLWCRGAWQFCNDYLQKTDIRQQYFKLFS